MLSDEEESEDENDENDDESEEEGILRILSTLKEVEKREAPGLQYHTVFVDYCKYSQRSCCSVLFGNYDLCYHGAIKDVTMYELGKVKAHPSILTPRLKAWVDDKLIGFVSGYATWNRYCNSLKLSPDLQRLVKEYINPRFGPAVVQRRDFPGCDDASVMVAGRIGTI